ncbi:hypothetical protein Aduo_015746 [Ancylostoma duodenale]
MSYKFKCDLIGAVEKEESLWNPDDDGYYKMEKKALAWNNVMKVMRDEGRVTELVDLRKWWKNLRDQWKKNRSLKTGSAAQKPWIFDENLKFLSVGESKR